MNEQIETLFINTYIQKQYRERLLFELKDITSKTHKRGQAFYKLSWAQDYVISQMVAVSSNKLTEHDVLSFVEKMVGDKNCYYMNAWEGEELPINEAIEKAFNDLGVSVIVYKDRFAIIKDETAIGAPNKIILVNSGEFNDK
ncbi:MAG: hypothetical protein J1F66_03825 [Clostridiales bacterium]|nr:hypothetical protein [Clostridiales bacterium]